MVEPIDLWLNAGNSYTPAIQIRKKYAMPESQTPGTENMGVPQVNLALLKSYPRGIQGKQC